MRYKKGISILVLSITIIVMIIITSTITISINTSISSAKLIEFAENIQKVSDEVINYYISNSSYPLKDDVEYSIDDIKLNLDESKIHYFEEEIAKNDDGNSSFRYLDISKLDLQNIKSGLQASGNTDIYIMAYPTENIYYLQGISIKGKYYFSLVNISNNKKVNQKLNEKLNMLGISYKKDKKLYTDNLGITINVNMKDGEVLYLKSNGNNETQVVTNIGDNVILVNTPFEATINNNLININKDTNSSPDYISVIKKDNKGIVIGNVDISVRNYDNINPIIDTESIRLVFEEQKNIFSFSASDNKNKIRQIKYEYIEKFDPDLKRNSYYNQELTIDKEYMQKFAKTKIISSNEDISNLSIELPRDVLEFAFCIVDGAGNYSNIVRSKTYELTSNIMPYVEVSLDSTTTNDIYVINLSVFDDDVIDSLDVTISKDGKEYGSINNISSGYFIKDGNITKASISFNGLDTNILYVKTTVNGRNKVTVVDMLDISNKRVDSTSNLWEFDKTSGRLKYYKGTLDELVSNSDTVEIPSHIDGVEVKIIGTGTSDNIFYMCDGIENKKLRLPNTVKIIDSNAFYGYSFIGDLIIPNSVISIGASAFECSNFTGNLRLGNSITSIGDGAFWDCSGFTGELIIPNSVKIIGDGAFKNCMEFTGELIIPDSVTSIGECAFEDCDGFTGNLVIGNSVTTIKDGAFWSCEGLTGELTIPDSVRTIGNDAFYDCTGLASVSIPSSTIVSDTAFDGIKAVITRR